jgi:hypothetical protein
MGQGDGDRHRRLRSHWLPARSTPLMETESNDRQANLFALDDRISTMKATGASDKSGSGRSDPRPSKDDAQAPPDDRDRRLCKATGLPNEVLASRSLLHVMQ